MSEDKRTDPYLKAIRLENFMAFEDTGWIELRPITLLFGKNSSGKSVIIRALRLLKQSLDTRPEEGALKLVSEHGVELGRFKNILNQAAQSNGRDREITFKLRIANVVTEPLARIFNNWRTTMGLAPYTDEERFRKDWTWLDVLLTYSEGPHEQSAVLSRFALHCPWVIGREEHGGLLFLAERDEITTAGNKSNKPEDEWQIQCGLLHEEGLDAYLERNLVTTSGFLPTLAATDPSGLPLLVQSAWGEIYKAIRKDLLALNHIGPLRPPPQRSYHLNALSQQQYAAKGLGSFYWFLQHGTSDSKLLLDLNSWVYRLGLGHAVVIEPNNALQGTEPGGSGLRSVWIEDKTNHKDNLHDVGSGTSQVLPILVQCIAANDGQLIAIEQPELHLHPSAQAEMADLFIEAAMAGRARLLIETHSEVLLLRIMRRIAEGAPRPHEEQDEVNSTAKQIRREQVVLHYSYKDKAKDAGTSEVYNINFDKTGNLQCVPPGFEDFFMDDMKETVARLKAERNRV